MMSSVGCARHPRTPAGAAPGSPSSPLPRSSGVGERHRGTLALEAAANEMASSARMASICGCLPIINPLIGPGWPLMMRPW